MPRERPSQEVWGGEGKFGHSSEFSSSGYDYNEILRYLVKKYLFLSRMVNISFIFINLCYFLSQIL